MIKVLFICICHGKKCGCIKNESERGGAGKSKLNTALIALYTAVKFNTYKFIS